MHTDRRRGSIVVALVTLVALVALIAGCGSDADDSSPDTTDTTEGGSTTTASTAPATEAEAGVVKIGVIAPLEDGLTQFGLGIENSVQLAVDQATDSDAIPGFTVEVVAVDDSSDPDTGRAAAEELAADGSVIGVVGTYNSGVAAEVAPVLQEAGIAMISPGNTDPTLTVGDDPAAPARQFDNYFRVVATDAQQGPFLADYASADLGAVTAAVVNEEKPVSQGLADDFTAAFTALGGQVVSTQVVPDGTTEFADVVAEIAPLEPDLLFFGGEYEVAAALRDQAADSIDAPLMGGDGIKDQAYIEAAGELAEGDIASSVGTPLDALTTAQDFLGAYDAAGFEEPPSDFGPYAYDAANLLITAAAAALADTEVVDADARAEVIGLVQSADVQGATGRVAFDEYGDTVTRVLTVYRVTDGVWAPVLTAEAG